MKTVLMTGSSGFLGRHLKKKLISKGVEVISIDSKSIDLTKDSDLNKIPNKEYDHIFHLAAWTRAGNFCEHFGGDQYLKNVAINTNILKWWLNNSQNAKFIGLGTSVSYSEGFSLCEENYMLGIPYDKFYAYAMSKRILYSGLKALNKQYGLKYLFLIPSTLYGPDYHADGRDLHFIYDLIRKIARKHYYNEDITLWGDGLQKRELVHVNDFIEILIKLNEITENEIFNIGAGEEHSIKEFASIICNYFNIDENEIKYNTKAYVGAKSKILSTNKLNLCIPNFEKTKLEYGIKETISWMINSEYFKTNKFN